MKNVSKDKGRFLIDDSFIFTLIDYKTLKCRCGSFMLLRIFHLYNIFEVEKLLRTDGNYAPLETTIIQWFADLERGRRDTD